MLLYNIHFYVSFVVLVDDERLKILEIIFIFFFFGSIVKMMMMKTEIHSDCLKMQTKQQQQQIADIDNQSDQLIFLETNKTKQKTSSLFTNNLYIFFTSWCIFLQKFRISLDVCVEKNSRTK